MDEATRARLRPMAMVAADVRPRMYLHGWDTGEVALVTAVLPPEAGGNLGIVTTHDADPQEVAPDSVVQVLAEVGLTTFEVEGGDVVRRPGGWVTLAYPISGSHGQRWTRAYVDGRSLCRRRPTEEDVQAALGETGAGR